MKRILFAILICLLSILCHGAGPGQAAERLQKVANDRAVSAPAVISIIPAQAEPGTSVTISGSGFGERITVFLGDLEIPAKITDARRVEFIIPLQVEPGIHLLYLKRSDGVTGRPYNFSVLPLRPVLLYLTPDKISACSRGSEREVTAHGRNFSRESMLFIDGAGLKSTVLSAERLSFIVPQVAGGLHQVQVRNAPDNASVSLALGVETRPDIDQVSIGAEYVNYYELVISGRNFYQNSTLFIDGQRVGTGGGQSASDREKLVYIDCNRLIYQRYPYSSVNKEFRIQVVNPGGEGSQVVQVNAP